MNWKIFEIKFDKKETWAFEQLSYLLFCEEFNNRIGLFRYKNQTGIETEPIEKGGKYYAFQSKYYTNSISNNKRDIIDSIKKAKSKNNQLNELYLYINQTMTNAIISLDSDKLDSIIKIFATQRDAWLFAGKNIDNTNKNVNISNAVTYGKKDVNINGSTTDFGTI